MKNETEFVHLLEETYRALGFFLRYLGLPADETEDMVQDVYIKAYNAFDRYESTKSFKAWVFSIAKNTYIDWTRRQKLQRKVLESSFVRDYCESFENDSTDRLQVREMLAGLSSEEQILIELRFFQDLPYGDISELTGMSVAAAKMRIMRIIGKVKTAFKKDRDE